MVHQTEIREISEALKENPTDIGLKVSLITVYLKLSSELISAGNLEEAVSNVLLAIEIAPERVHPTVFGFAIDNFLATNEVKKAESLITILENVNLPENEGELARTRLSLAKKNLEIGEHEKAVDIYLKLINKDKNDNALFSMIFRNLKNLNLVENIYQILEHKLKDDLLFLAHIYERICHMTYLMGDFEDSRLTAKYATECRLKKAKELNLDKLPIDFILPDQTNGMGQVSYIGFQVRLRKLGWLKTELTYLRPPEETANPCLMRYIGEHLSIISDKDIIEKLTNSIGPYRTRRVAYIEHEGKMVREDHLNGLVEREWRKQGRGPLLNLKKSDEERGRSQLKKFGLKEDDWFVGIHMRENKDARNGKIYSPRDVQEVSTYFKAMSAITDAGGWVFRMGDPSMSKLPKLDRVIDLVHTEYNSDWLDVFLWAKSKFFIGVNSGPAFAPREFGTPAVFTNWLPLSLRPTSIQDIFLPKLMFSKTKNRFLTFREFFAGRCGYGEDLAYLHSQNIDLIDNSEEELKEVVQEMMDRLVNGPSYTAEDEERQKQFQYICEEIGGSIGDARIGNSFIKKYQELLK